MEEGNIEIEEISGTSMGAIIGSLIAFGMTFEEIKDFAKSMNYLKLVDIDFKTGLLKGNKIEKKLEEIFGDKKIEDTKISLKIVATNIETSESTIFRKGKIVDAIRASISLPGIFIPKEIDGNIYLDGGIMMNLPVEALDGKNILAVSALKINTGKIIKNKKYFGLNFKTGFLKNNFEIIKRAVIAMMKVNEEQSLKTLNKNITLIRPNFGDLDIIHFNKVDEFIEIGYSEIKKIF
ncbi:MAG: patatin-like phospholipase family protein [Candidatus Gracilibacteria bacterium]|nr:patatin-like phospholipase family protein [Candidatus Gracilibacteria bacterium]